MAIMEINFYSKMLKRSTTLMAVLPVDRLDRSFSKKHDVDNLRVLYLLHGYAGNHMDWLYGAQIVELSLKYNVAIFMPCGENSFYLDDEDREAYYSEYIGNELIEFTRNVFPIPEDREKRLLVGSLWVAMAR